jgi:leader peptidase (prepilin peptidase)/N-methyltransferase
MGLLSSYSLALVSTIFCLDLIALAVIDLKTMTLPDFLTWPLMMLGVTYNLISINSPTSFSNALLGAAFGYAILWLINQIYLFISGKEGLGMGDAKLLAAIGSLLGPSCIIPILLISSLLGVVGGGIWLMRRQLSSDHPFPFGPYLCITGITLILDSNLKIGILQYLAL